MSRITPFQIAMGVGTAGTLEEVTEYADLAAGVQRSWGRRTEFEDIPPGTFSFVLDNSDGRFTPGNTASPLTTTVTEGMRVCWNAGGRLVDGTILAIEPTFPSDESAWAQIRITCDDMLGNAGRRSLGVLAESVLEGATPYLFWPLDDAAGTIVPVESIQAATGLLTLTTTKGSTFGATAITGIAGTQLTLKDSLASTSGTAWPTFDFTYPTTTLGFYSFWLTTITASTKVTASVSISGLARSLQFGYTSGAYFVRDGDTGTPATYTSADTGPHYVSMGLGSTYAASVWTITATLYVDGTSRGSIVYGSTPSTLTYRAPVGISITATV